MGILESSSVLLATLHKIKNSGEFAFEDLTELIFINIHFIFHTHQKPHGKHNNYGLVFFSVQPQIVLFVLIGVSVSSGKCKIYGKLNAVSLGTSCHLLGHMEAHYLHITSFTYVMVFRLWSFLRDMPEGTVMIYDFMCICYPYSNSLMLPLKNGNIICFIY